MNDQREIRVDALLGRIDRVRELARRLVLDAAEADDLVQDALAAALARPGPVHPASDGWISTVLRNRLRDRQRSTARRGAREAALARPDAEGPDTSDVVANAERQRDVVEAVLALEDPYRETLLMRFFEDLAPREIVRRTGRSSETVKKHLARGLDQVRRRLEKRYGDDGRWAVALLPIIGTKGLAPVAGTLGVGLASKPLRALLVVLVAIGIAVPSWLLWRTTWGGATDAAATLARLAPTPNPAEPLVEPNDAAPRQAGDVEHAAHGQQAPDPEPTMDVRVERVRLLDLSARPMPLADVAWTWASFNRSEATTAPHVAKGRTDEDGRVELSGPTSPDLEGGEWSINGEPYAPIGCVRDIGRTLVVLAPAVRVAGVVVDEVGDVVAGADVTAWIQPELVDTLPAELQSGAHLRSVGRTTDSLGRFDFGFLPSHESFELEVSLTGYGPVREPLPDEDVLDLTLALGAKLPPGRWMTGTVVEEGGSPIEGASVTFGWRDAVTDATGRFKIEVPGDPEQESVVARAQDGRFATLPCPGDVIGLAEGAVADDVALIRIPSAMPALRGQLLDGDGAPLAGVFVFAIDGTPAGGRTSVRETGGEADSVETDVNGCFTLPFCEDRPYHLRFVDEGTMLVHDEHALRPGPTVHVIRIPDDAFVERLEGRIIDAHGEPLADAEVRLQARTTAPDSRIGSFRSGRSAHTDADGQFTIVDAPWRGLAFYVRTRPNTRGATHEIGDVRPDAPLVITVDLDCRVEITGERADVQRIEVHDSRGKPMITASLEAGMTTWRSSVVRTKAGHFPPFEVPQRAAKLVLIGAEGALDELPVRLSPSRPNRIELP